MQHCISIFEIKETQKQRSLKRTESAKRKFKLRENAGIWKSLRGNPMPVHGNSKAPPYSPSNNRGKIAEGMDRKLWKSSKNSMGVFKWHRIE
jgi:hypothetical protein